MPEVLDLNKAGKTGATAAGHFTFLAESVWIRDHEQQKWEDY